MDGYYDEVQCDDRLKTCWCVDEDGIELPDSRKPGDISSPPNCTDGKHFHNLIEQT